MTKMASTTKAIVGIVIGLLFIGGAIATFAANRTIKAQVDSTQDSRIFRAEENIESVKDEVGNIKLKAAEELATKKAIFDTLSRMETAQQAMTTDVGAMKIDVATTKIQVDNLERKQ